MTSLLKKLFTTVFTLLGILSLSNADANDEFRVIYGIGTDINPVSLNTECGPCSHLGGCRARVIDTLIKDTNNRTFVVDLRRVSTNHELIEKLKDAFTEDEIIERLGSSLTTASRTNGGCGPCSHLGGCRAKVSPGSDLVYPSEISVRTNGGCGPCSHLGGCRAKVSPGSDLVYPSENFRDAFTNDELIKKFRDTLSKDEIINKVRDSFIRGEQAESRGNF